MRQETAFAGRARERQQALAALTAGPGVVITGATGLGKTALAASISRDLPVFWASAAQTMRQVPFGVFGGLLHEDDQIHPALIPAHVTTRLVRRSGRKVPVLVIDDAHLLDDSSAGAVLTLALGGKVKLVVTAQAEDVPEAVRMLWKDGYLCRVDLAPFHRRDTAELLRALLNGDVASPTIELLHQRSGGSPRALADLVRQGRETGQIMREGGLLWWREGDDEVLTATGADFHCWVDRDPDKALELLDDDELRAPVLLLSGRTREALDLRTPLTVAFGQAMHGKATPELTDPKHASVIAVANAWSTGEIPLTDPVLGRWLYEPGELKPMPWPLLDGYVRWLRGERNTAIARLREAVVQHAGGWRWFHSEAASWLAIGLAEEGDPDEAEQVLATVHSDPIALLPGLRLKARAAIAVAHGDLTAAANHLEAAIAAAHEAACPAVELDYLIEAMHLRLPVADELDRVLRRVEGPRLIASGSAALALTRRDGAELLHRALEMDRLGLGRLAWRTAETAAAILKRREHPRTAEAIVLVARLRELLHREAPADAPRGLTSREMQVAALAVDGLTDREIAGRLSVSVRTVESHLARVYHKLGVHSRQDLPRDLRRHRRQP
ncbi:LuxR C-terminal-related transcriptional regulator [Actinocrispum sp. NPDC049592]|uniref:LuxR C-terminal-related transcriptional regulator n=1 Tax=Actinocrispum sp. NPDC049592 TaxID=3154835 RepID=UPI003435C9F8